MTTEKVAIITAYSSGMGAGVARKLYRVFAGGGIMKSMVLRGTDEN